MPVKIRLQRFGKKGQPFYHIVIADGRAPRDGKFIEKIGTYNPLTKPATIDINIDKAVKWIQNGAQPTETTKAILSYKGVLYKEHLLRGVKKGALTQEQADAKFEAWTKEKTSKINNVIVQLKDSARTEEKKRLEEEAKIKEQREKALAEARAKAAAKEAEQVSEAVAEEAVAEAAEESIEEEPKAE